MCVCVQGLTASAAKYAGSRDASLLSITPNSCTQSQGHTGTQSHGHTVTGSHMHTDIQVFGTLHTKRHTGTDLLTFHQGWELFFGNTAWQSVVLLQQNVHDVSAALSVRMDLRGRPT